MTKKFKPLRQNQFPQTKNIKFIIGLEKQASAMFKLVAASIVKDIAAHFKSNKLAKADRLPKGWLGEVPKINIDLEKIVNPVMKKHMDALRWLLYGDAAGKDAKAAAKDVGIKAKAIPGLLPSSYLASIDAQRDYYTEVMGKPAPEMDKDLLLQSMKELMVRTQKFLDEFSMKFGNGLTEALQKNIDEQNYTNVSQALLMAHEAVDTGSTGAEAIEGVASEFEGLDLPKIRVDISGIVEQVGANWDLFANANIGMASSVGTHQAMNQIYGSNTSDIKVVLMTNENEKVCPFCAEKSRLITGQYIYYDLTDFKPTGYNYGKKRKEWELQIPPEHPRCYCTLIYVPSGFFVDKDHTLKKI